MSEPAEYDVAIVGASLAGCTAATLFGRAGRSVALIESHPDIKAYKKLCTTLIQPCATPTIQRLGLDTRIEAAGGLRTHSTLHTRWGWTLPPADDDFYGYDIRREKLDPMIRELAADGLVEPGSDRLVLTRRGRLLASEVTDVQALLRGAGVFSASAENDVLSLLGWRSRSQLLWQVGEPTREIQWQLTARFDRRAYAQTNTVSVGLLRRF